MFVMVNDTNKSFMKAEYFVIRSSVIKHSYKWAVVDVLLQKITFTSTVQILVIKNSEVLRDFAWYIEGSLTL